jgi:hypothetical protein
LIFAGPLGPFAFTIITHFSSFPAITRSRWTIRTLCRAHQERLGNEKSSSFAVKIDNKVELDRCSTGRAVNARVGKAAHAIRGAPDCEKLLAWSFSSGFPRTWENGYRLGKGMRDGKDNRLCCHDESGAWSVLPRVAWS